MPLAKPGNRKSRVILDDLNEERFRNNHTTLIAGVNHFIVTTEATLYYFCGRNTALGDFSGSFASDEIASEPQFDTLVFP